MGDPKDCLDITLRQAERKDASTVFRILQALAGYHGPETVFTATLEDVVRDGFGPTPVYESWLAEHTGQAVGLATFFRTYSTFRGQLCLYLDNLYVEPHARRQGVGRLLITQVGKRALDWNCCCIVLSVSADNPASAFYESLGFSRVPDVVCSIAGEELKQLANPFS